jgi:hypothetical protein
MARERIDNMSEAKHLLRHEHRERPTAYLVTEVDALAAGPHNVTGVGMDGFQADFGALRDAERDLAALHDELLGQLNEAAELTGPLNDGTSPVAAPMRKAFHSRANNEGGVQTALQQYLTELIGVRIAILKTLATYEGIELDMVSQLQQQLIQLEGIA